MGSGHTEVAAFIGFAAQGKLVQFVNARAFAHHTLAFGFFLVTRWERNVWEFHRQTIPPLVGPLCRSVGAQSTAQHWHMDLLTSIRLPHMFKAPFLLYRLRGLVKYVGTHRNKLIPGMGG